MFMDEITDEFVDDDDDDEPLHICIYIHPHTHTGIEGRKESKKSDVIISVRSPDKQIRSLWLDIFLICLNKFYSHQTSMKCEVKAPIRENLSLVLKINKICLLIIISFYGQCVGASKQNLIIKLT